MSVNIVLVIVVGVMVGCGVTLCLERSLTRILVGFVLIGNGINIMFLIASGDPGTAPLIGASDEPMSDPLPQAMALTAIVITMGVAAFGLALAYRSWQLAGTDDVQDDLEDEFIRRRAETDEVSTTFDDVDEGLPDEYGSDEEEDGVHPRDLTTDAEAIDEDRR